MENERLDLLQKVHAMTDGNQRLDNLKKVTPMTDVKLEARATTEGFPYD